MEKQREKRIKICNTKETQSESASFPIDITSEILLRLPEKSIARFRCVSKLWLSISTDPYFINLFEIRYPRPSLVLCHTQDDMLCVSLVRQHHHTLWNSKKPDDDSDPCQPFDYHMKLSKANRNFQPTESVHGLVCFEESETPIVWNPSTRQLTTLPKPRKSWKRLQILLGYDPIESKHKVVCIPLARSTDVCRVLTLGSSAQESWRTVRTKLKHRSDRNITTGRCINGVVYYIAYVFQKSVWVLMSFDVRSETFDMIELPSDIYRETLITYEGKLACFKLNVVYSPYEMKTGIKLYILEDGEQRKWSIEVIRALKCYHDKNFNMGFRVKGITPAGEFIYAGYSFRPLFPILFFDPVRKSFRRLELKGTADHEGRNSSKLHVLANHVESLMPL